MVVPMEACQRCVPGVAGATSEKRAFSKIEIENGEKVGGGVLCISIDVSTVVATLLVENQPAEVYDWLIYVAVRISSPRTAMASSCSVS